MVSLYVPTKPKRLRRHKAIPRGGQRFNRPMFTGSQATVYGSGHGSLNWRHLEAGRRFLVRQVRRSRVRVLVRLHQPLTAKSKQARMGKGKGKHRGWIGYLQPGTPLYEVGPTVRRSWSHHRSSQTRLGGPFPFERMAQKFSYPLVVRRQPILQWRRHVGATVVHYAVPHRRRSLTVPQPPRLWASRQHPSGVLRGAVVHGDSTDWLPGAPKRAAPAPLSHWVAKLLQYRQGRRLPHRRYALLQLLLHLWQRMARMRGWTPANPPVARQLENTLLLLQQLLERTQALGRLSHQRRLLERQLLRYPHHWRALLVVGSDPRQRRRRMLRRWRSQGLWRHRWLGHQGAPRLLLWRTRQNRRGFTDDGAAQRPAVALLLHCRRRTLQRSQRLVRLLWNRALERLWRSWGLGLLPHHAGGTPRVRAGAYTFGLRTLRRMLDLLKQGLRRARRRARSWRTQRPVRRRGAARLRRQLRRRRRSIRLRRRYWRRLKRVRCRWRWCSRQKRRSPKHWLSLPPENTPALFSLQGAIPAWLLPLLPYLPSPLKQVMLEGGHLMGPLVVVLLLCLLLTLVGGLWVIFRPLPSHLPDPKSPRNSSLAVTPSNPSGRGQLFSLF